MNEGIFPIPVPFEFEKFPNAEEEFTARSKEWYRSIIYSVLYLVIISSLRAYMKTRPAFDLRLPLVLWNLGLATVSILGTCRMIPGYLHMVFNFGYAFSLCDNIYGLSMDVTLFWGNIFTRLKILEFGDTVFLVLRKKKLRFLHWYHHAMTLVVTEYSISSRLPIGQSCIITNYFIHSLMYSYYAAKMMRLKVPKLVSMSLTSLQILQTVFNVIQCCFAVYYRWTLSNCYFPSSGLILLTFMYFSYFVLFCYFFYTVYLKPEQELKKVQ